MPLPDVTVSETFEATPTGRVGGAAVIDQFLAALTGDANPAATAKPNARVSAMAARPR